MAQLITHEFYEVRSPNDSYGLELRGNETTSEEKALEGINRLYLSALARGYDNSHRKWIIVCNLVKKHIDDNGNFLKEETTRFITEQVEFSHYENAFVFTF